MCKVSSIKNSEKQIKVTLSDGRVIRSNWFEDVNKTPVEDAVNMTEAENSIINTLLEESGSTNEHIVSWTTFRKKENDTVYVSEHAFKRAKERLGWNEKTTLRMLKKVYDLGTRDKDIKGALSLWIKERMSRYSNGEYSILYGNHLFIFQDNMLVTVLHTPTKVKIETKIGGEHISKYQYAAV